MFVIMIAMVILGVPVMIAMFATAIAGMWWINGFTMVLTQFTNGPFTSSASYSYALCRCLPAGPLASETGIAQGAYNSMRAFWPNAEADCCTRPSPLRRVRRLLRKSYRGQRDFFQDRRARNEQIRL